MAYRGVTGGERSADYGVAEFHLDPNCPMIEKADFNRLDGGLVVVGNEGKATRAVDLERNAVEFLDHRFLTSPSLASAACEAFLASTSRALACSRDLRMEEYFLS